MSVWPETGGATWDPARHQVLLVLDTNRTWTWDGSCWCGGTAPAPMAASPSLGYSPAFGTDIAYGYPGRTAAWTGGQWQLITTTGHPPTSGPLVLDPDLGGLVLVGKGVMWLLTPGISSP